MKHYSRVSYLLLLLSVTERLISIVNSGPRSIENNIETFGKHDSPQLRILHTCIDIFHYREI